MCNLPVQLAPVVLNDLSVEAASANQVFNIPANPDRRSLFIMKRGSNGQAFLKFNGTPAAPFRDCIVFNTSGQTLEFGSVVPVDAFDILIASATDSVVIYEGELAP